MSEPLDSPALAVAVEFGEIVVNSVRLVVDAPDAKIFYIDMASKRVGVAASSSSEGHHGLVLYADEHTLYADKTADRHTEITVSGLDGDDWFSLVDSGRYTVVWCLYRQREGVEVPVLWERERTADAAL